MAKKPIGKVISIIKTSSSENGVVLNLIDSLSVGDKVTFDGWQEGSSIAVEKLNQNHKNVTTAVPGTASIFVNSSLFIQTGSGIYKITEDQQAQGVQTASTNSPSQGEQGPEVIPIAFVAGAAGPVRQSQGKAANEVNQQAQQNHGTVVSNIDINNFLLGQNPFANNATSISIQLINLPATATEFLKYAPSYTTNIKSKTMSYRSWYVLIASMFIVTIAVLGQFYQGAPVMPLSILLLTFFAEFLISGAILLYLGFKDFSFEQFLQSIPVAKIDAATYSLNKMQGKFIPYNTGPLKAPISGAECVYYSVGLYVAFYEGFGRNRQFVVQRLGGIGKGAPTLFTDGSGYLAVDLVKAPNLQATSSVLILNKTGGGATNVIEQGKEAAAEILPQIEEASNSNSTVDLSKIPNFKVKPYFQNRIKDLKKGLNALEIPNGIFLVEQYIPVNSDYTCLGGVADISKSIDGKPVKVMVPDQGSGIMAVYVGAAENIKKSISKRTMLNIAIGVMFIIGALVLLSFYFGSASAASAAKITTIGVAEDANLMQL